MASDSYRVLSGRVGIDSGSIMIVMRVGEVWSSFQACLFRLTAYDWSDRRLVALTKL